MVTITEPAQEYLSELLHKQDVEGIAVRIFILDAGTPRAETCISFCRPGEEKEDDIISEPAVGFESETPAKEEKKFTLSTQGTPKKAKSEEFDSLFEDDLPF